MAQKVSAVLPSGSAPDLRRGHLEKLLSQARPTPAPSEISRSSRRAPGGAPYKAAPPVRQPTGTTIQSLRTGLASAGSEALRATAQSSAPALSPQHPGATEPPSRVGSSRKEEVGSYIKQLVGDDGQHWRLLKEMDAIDGLIQEDMERHRVAEQKARQRLVLEQQVREARKKDHDFKSSRMHWGSKLQADAAQWQEEERLKKIQQHEALRKFNEEQARHAEASRRRKDAEAEELAQLERAMAEQAADATRQQELANERRRKRQQEMAKQMADAAKEAAQQKALRKQEEAQKDMALMQAQIELMEAQERQRSRSLEVMKQKQGKVQAQYEAGAGSEKARLQKEISTVERGWEDILGKEEEERAKRYQDEKYERDEAALQDKQKRMKQLHMDGVAFLSRQLQEQASMKAAEKEEQRRCRETSDRDAAAALEEERRKASARKKKEKENADFLQQQISQKTAAKRANEQMTEVEQSMNKDRLERARKPEVLHLMAQNKLRQFGHPDHGQ